jgi:hypothetical protein
MADTIQFKRGTTAARVAVTPAIGEPIWDKDKKCLFVGDGATLGGIPVNDVRTVTLTSNFTGTLSLTNTALTFPIGANKSYAVELELFEPGDGETQQYGFVAAGCDGSFVWGLKFAAGDHSLDPVGIGGTMDLIRPSPASFGIKLFGIVKEIAAGSSTFTLQATRNILAGSRLKYREL